MDRGMDRHLQRIIEMSNASNGNSSSRPEQAPDYAVIDARPADFSFQSMSRQPNQDTRLLDELDQNSYNPRPSRQPLNSANSAPSRISIASLNVHSQPAPEPRAITNADNHFRFAQNLRQGVLINRAPPAKSLTKTFSKQQSPLTQLANNMLSSRPIPQASPEVDLFQSLDQSRLSQMQPRRQEFTPPFNLAGFSYGSNLQQSASSSNSSPLDIQPSSPTARISLRRASNRAAPSSEPPLERDHGFEDTHEGLEAPPETPKHQMAASARAVTKYTPQNLALGHAPPMAHGIQLVSPYELPDRFRQVFPYELFNAAQSKCFAPIYKSNDNIVVSAPTGSGKTVLLELAICKLVEGHPSGQFKIVYQAPTKSLCSERMRDWQKKFSHLNLTVAELTGDTGHREMNSVGAASIIVTTPEKWDSITRKWKDYSRLLQMVKLFLIDEVHILKDTRGATLEAVVSRMKTSGANVRFVALSATVPNSQDIAVWLGRDHTNDHVPAHRETFGEDFRPVRLQKHVHGYDGLPNEFAFEKVLDGKLPNLIQKYTQKKPAMIFCFTRKSCEGTAFMLAEWWTRQRVVDRSWPAPVHTVRVGSKELRDLVGCGVAFHHAGLDPQDRHAVESGFLKGDISVICCTSTLAVGVNLPCHLVVLKGTVCFQDGNMSEYSDLEVMQMLGRAGRPQFDDSAVAIIMTRTEKADKYKKMISGQDILESTLHLNLIEYLNSEIGLGTVRDKYTAKKWLMGTFLSVRMRQNPDYYKLDGVAPNRDSDERLEQVCERDIKLLVERKLVEEKDGRLTSTEYGQAMSRYMVQFETMKLLLNLEKDAKTEKILHLLCQATEFKSLRMKPNERPSLRELNKSPFMKFPVGEKNISTTAHKISIMIQVQLGGIDLPITKEFSIIRRQFIMEKTVIFERIQRLIRCIVDCVAFDCNAIATRHSLDLARSLSAEYWENSNLQLRQIPGIGPVAVRKFVQGGISSIEGLITQDTATIERILGKNPPYGRKMLDTLAEFPRLTIISKIVGKATTKAGHEPKVNIEAKLGYSNIKIPVWQSSRPSLTFVAETTSGKLAHFWRGNISKLDKGFVLKFFVCLENPEDEIKCSLACDDIVGTLRSCRLNPGIPASAFPPQKLEQTTLEKHLVKGKDSFKEADEFGTDGIEDDELLAAANKIDAPKSPPTPAPGSFHKLEEDSDGFADIDGFDDVIGNSGEENFQAQVLESVRMENGRWTCAHVCRGDQLLKKGQQCKHKCCREGVEKRPGPRRLKPKSSIGTGVLLPSESNTAKSGKKDKSGTSKKAPSSNATKAGPSSKISGPSKLRPKSIIVKQRESDPQEDTEVIDLAEQLTPMPYSKVAPREYRKLHNLHESVQKDKSSVPVRLPKSKPHFSYASGNEPDLPFLRGSEAVEDDIFGESDDDLPSPSALAALLKGDSEDTFKSGGISYNDPTPTSVGQYRSMESLEEGMMALEEPLMRRTSTPKISSSFAQDVFDFDAFDENYGDTIVYTSPLMRETRKRERSQSPDLPKIKHQRVSKIEPKTSPPIKDSDSQESYHISDIPQVESRRVTKEVLSQQKQQAPEQHAVPSWVNDFDSELIQSLMGIVDFVE